MPIERPFATSYVLAIAMFALYHHLWDNHIYIFQSTLFRYLTLKMKVKDIDYLDENWQANLRYHLAYQYVCQNWRFWVQPFVCSFSCCECTYVHTSIKPAKIALFNCIGTAKTWQVAEISEIKAVVTRRLWAYSIRCGKLKNIHQILYVILVVKVISKFACKLFIKHVMSTNIHQSSDDKCSSHFKSAQCWYTFQPWQ